MRLEHMGVKKIISIGIAIAIAKKDVQICFEKNF